MGSFDYDLRHTGRFKIGDRVLYKNFDSILTPGTIKKVQKKGYRIEWDDGFKDLPGEKGVYREEELIAEGEPYE